MSANDIAVFIKARIDDDERIALSVQDNSAPWTGQWKVDGEHALRTYNDWVLASHHPEPFRPGFLTHVAHHDPARVLRGVEAKRRLIADLLAQEHFLNDREWYGCRAVTDGRGDEPDQPTGEPCTCGRDEDVERRLRLMASEWSTHESYREEWKL